MQIEFPPESVTVKVPTLVVWAEDDVALPVTLLEGLEDYVPSLRIVRVSEATHWIIHERPTLIIEQIERELLG
jgi:pimeloyl-ACP methyl ester carboxylesterase